MQSTKFRAGTVFIKLAAMSLVLAGASGCSAAARAADEPAGGRVEILDLKVENTQYEALDLGRPGESLGDMDVYSGNAIRDGRNVGQGGGSCQIIHVDGGKVTMQCLITMKLARGSLTMQSVWTRGTSPLDMAITGGTGEYRNARGTARFWDIATPNERVRAEIIR